MDYYSEQFTDEEQAILSKYFTNVDSPVFALINLPEVIKGALFARYSRSSKSMRRLFLDEFVRDKKLLLQPKQENSQSTCLADVDHAAELFDKIFTEYGDDSVAQLGGAHIACEQASNILTKVLEKGRLASYLEQSTRYIWFDKLLGGSFRYYVPGEIAKGGFLSQYREVMDFLFRSYNELAPLLSIFYSEKLPRPSSVAEVAWKASIRAKVCDDLRGLLPAATLSNVGIYASGQAFESLIIKMRCHHLEEVRKYSELMLTELRKIVPSFMRRVDLPSRGVRWSHYFGSIDARMRQISSALREKPTARPSIMLVEWDPDAEIKIIAAALYPYCQLPEDRLLAIVKNMTDEERSKVFTEYCGVRENRRHRPGRAFERAFYRFDILAPYSVFRDLQRHRMLTIEWQELGTEHGFVVPDAVEEIGQAEVWREAMLKASGLYDDIERSLGSTVAQYVVPFGFRIRFYWHLNAREAVHVIELRTQRGGDPVYRKICQEMHRLIRDQAKHVAIADSMCFVDAESYELGRLEGEQRAVERRANIEASSR